MPGNDEKNRVLVSDSYCQYFCGDFAVLILRWTRFISINESLTLDSLPKLDSNHCDSESQWGCLRIGAKSFFRGG
jgi:hypothetical protein